MGFASCIADKNGNDWNSNAPNQRGYQIIVNKVIRISSYGRDQSIRVDHSVYLISPRELSVVQYSQ